MPKVSVIIPNYNHADFLNRRIDSVLNQTYSDFELILLDDCSTDRSYEILLSYKDHPRVSQIVFNVKNSGSPFEQWAKGFELATGDFIWIAESDDWCESTLLENLVKPLLEDESLVLSFCQSLLVDDSGEIIYKTECHQLEQSINGRDFVASQMFGDTVLVNAGMAVFRKSSLNKIDCQYRNMKSAGDWMFWVNIALTGNVFILGKYLNYFRRNIDTVSSKAEVTGVDIEEGNKVFTFVLHKSKPVLIEQLNAIKQRLDIYFQQKKRYENKTISRNSLTSILNLCPEAKRVYRNQIIKRFIKTFIGKVVII
ncbi:MAG: glycosyltransferase [Paludibacter sp.]|nr:glycosyltransferase [Paludibacter sp.]